MTLCNNRLDTPLHNAARWNHPSLVNELLLYGARYTALNKDHKSPADLTTDDQVRELIWKASQGIIAVGSYSPLQRPVDHAPGGALASSTPVCNSASPEAEEGGVAKPQGEGGAEEEERSRDLGDGSCDLSEYDMIEDVAEHRPLGDQQQGTESKEQSPSEEHDVIGGVEGEGLAESPLPVAAGEMQQKPHPQRDEKLISLLKAIEVFDRYVCTLADWI